MYCQELSFRSSQDIHNYCTRKQNELHRNKVSHEFAKNSLMYSLSSIVNATSKMITDKVYTHSPQGYCSYIKISIFRITRVHVTLETVTYVETSKVLLI